MKSSVRELINQWQRNTPVTSQERKKKKFRRFLSVERRPFFESLEARALLTASNTIVIDPTTIYEGSAVWAPGNTVPPAVSPGWTKITHSVAPTNFPTQSTGGSWYPPTASLQIIVTGEIDAYSFVGSPVAATLISTNAPSQRIYNVTGQVLNSPLTFFVSALEDEFNPNTPDINDAANDSLSFEFRLSYQELGIQGVAPPANAPYLLSSTSSSLTIIDNDIPPPTQKILLSNDDPDAVEPHSTYYLPVSPVDFGSFKVTMPSAWSGVPANSEIQIAFSGTATFASDYSVSLANGTPVGVILTYLNFPPDTISVVVPSNVGSFVVDVVPLADNEEVDTPESVFVDFILGQTFVGANNTPIVTEGNASVTITDDLEGLNLTATPSETKEFRTEPTFASFIVKPDDTNVLMKGSAKLEIDASQFGDATPGADYDLFVNGIVLPLTPKFIGSLIYVTDPFSVNGFSQVDVEVRPKADKVLEDKEKVRAELFAGPALTVSHGTANITISDDYNKARTEKDEKSGCGCTCPTCTDGIPLNVLPQDGQATASTAEGNIAVQTDGLGGVRPIIFVGLTLPAGKVVPTTIEIMAQTIEKDVDSNGALRGLGRKPVSTVFNPFLIDVPASALPGQVLWFVFQVDLSAQFSSWTRNGSGNPANSSGVTEQIIPLEILAHPIFPALKANLAPVVTADKYSGWVGQANHAVQSRSLAPGFGNEFYVPGVDRMIRNQTVLVPDPNAAPGSVGKVVQETGSMLFRADGSTSWFKDNSTTPPDTQDVLSGNNVTDTSGNVSTFDALGNLVSRTDPAGNTLAYQYNANGSVSKIISPSNQETSFTYSTDAISGFPVATISQTLANGKSKNFSLRMDALATNPNRSYKVRYDDPDGPALPRIAREDSFIYLNGQLRQIQVGEIGNPTHTTFIDYSSTFNRAVGTVTFPDLSSLTLDVAKISHSVITSAGIAGTINVADDRSFKIAPGGAPNPTRNYASITRKNSPSSLPQQTIVQLDHRGRVLRQWDPVQVNALGLAQNSMSDLATYTKLQANIDLSDEYTRSPVNRDSLGNVTGTDWGEVLTTLSPDPDKVLVNGIVQSNGPMARQSVTYTYNNNNPATIQRPLQPIESLTWNNQFDIPTLYSSESENKLSQTIDPLTGLVSSVRLDQSSPLDVNGSGTITQLDSLIVINYVNLNGSGPVPANQPFLDVSLDGQVSALDSLMVSNYLNILGSGPYGDLPSIAQKIDYQYTNAASGLPKGLVTQEKRTTGRASGDVITNYTYYNLPTDQARHGKLATITEVGTTSAVTQLFYDDRGNVNQVTDPGLRNTFFVYDNRDRLVSVTYPDPDGAGSLLPVVVRYDYDVFNNVIATEQINSRMESTSLVVTALITSYTYDNANRVTGVFTQRATNNTAVGGLPTGNWFVYSNGGTLALTSNRTTAVANPITPAILTTYANGNSRITNLPSSNTALQGLVTTISYFGATSPNSIKTTETDIATGISRTSEVVLDRMNRTSQSISPDPVSGLTTTTTDVRINGGFVTTVTYDNLSNVLSVTDGLGNATSFSYDDLNRPVKISSPNPNSGPTLDTLMSYQVSRLGWSARQTDPIGNTTQVDIDALGRTRAVSGATSRQDYRFWSDGLLKSTLNELGKATNYDYDARGRLTTITEPPVQTQTGPQISVTTFQYTNDNLLSSITDPMSRVTTFGYDALGRRNLIVEPDPDGTGSLLAAQTTFVRDAFGNILSKADALGQTYSATYDSWSRPLTQRNPRGSVITTAYDAFSNVTSVTDALANATTYTYNRLDQVVSENKPVSGTAALRTFSYDGVGNLRSMTDRNGRITNYSYDKLYRMTGEQWGAGIPTRTIDYTYNNADQLVAVNDSDPLATDFQFVYDSRSQLQLERQVNGLVGSSWIVDRDYDVNGYLTQTLVNLGGTISGSSISGGITDLINQYVYDDMSRLFSVQQRGNIDGTGAPLANSNVVAPKTVTYNYNLASQVTDVRRYSDTSSTNLEVHTRNTYDLAGRLRSITHGKSEIAAGQSWNGTSTLPASLGAANMLAGYFMVYDRDNRLTSLASQKDAFRTTYTYNTDDELTAATSTQIAGMTLPNPLPAAESYNLDLMGNRRTSAGVSQSANGTQNQLQTDGTFNYLYDGEGNITRRTTIATGAVVEYTWDFRNRMTTVTNKTSATGTVTKRVEFVYDAFDRRVAKRIDNDGNGTWDRYDAWLWDGQDEIEQFRDSDGQGTGQGFRISNRYLFGGNVDELLSDEQYTGNTGFALGSTTPSTTAGNTLWALTDHLGSVRDVVDNNGVIRQHVVYDGFGRRLREVDYNAAGAVIAGTDPAAIDVLFGYTGRDWDADVALQYNRARWYDPATGRWTSRDPIGFAAGDGNLYRYVGNGATGATDPSGLEPPSSVGPVAAPLDPEAGLPPVKIIPGEPIGTLPRVGISPGTSYPTLQPYSKPESSNYNEYTRSYIRDNLMALKVDLVFKITEMLSKNAPITSAGDLNGIAQFKTMELTCFEREQVANILADIYINAVDEFLRTRSGAAPSQGNRNIYLSALGISNEFNHPWCDDWARFINKYFNDRLYGPNRHIVSIDGVSCPLGKIVIIDRYYWVGGHLEHNYNGIRPWGYLVGVPPTNDDGILLLDPWSTLLPKSYWPSTHSLPPSGQGVKPINQ